MHERSERDTQNPPPDQRVAALLSAAAAPTEHGPVPGEESAMAAFRVAHQTASSRRSRMFRHPRPLKIAAAAAMGTGVLLAGGLAPIASGSLPGAAQETAREMLSKFGVTVPGPDEHSSGRTDERGKSADAKEAAGSEGSAEEAADNQGKGDEVSELARNTDATGGDKGAEISEYASQGRSHAGENGGDGSSGPPDSAGSSAGHAQVDTPNSGGTDRPDQASGGNGGNSDGNGQVDTPNSGGADRPEQASGGGNGGQERSDRSASGRATADEASDGRRADGSQNRP
ncbi:MAG: hypothetical protein ACRDO0_17100 [Nocardioidaceae bacterium]